MPMKEGLEAKDRGFLFFSLAKCSFIRVEDNSVLHNSIQHVLVLDADIKGAQLLNAEGIVSDD